MDTRTGTHTHDGSQQRNTDRPAAGPYVGIQREGQVSADCAITETETGPTVESFHRVFGMKHQMLRYNFHFRK